MTLEAMIEHLKICTQRTDNLGYRTSPIATQIYQNELKEIETEDTISLVSQKELMESTSSTPFQRTAT